MDATSSCFHGTYILEGKTGNQQAYVYMCKAIFHSSKYYGKNKTQETNRTRDKAQCEAPTHIGLTPDGNRP